MFQPFDRLQIIIVQQILDEQLSVRALEKAVRQRAEKKADKKPEASPKQLIKSAGILEIEERLSDQLLTKVQIVQNKNGRGQIVVHFSGDEDLHRVFVSLRNETEESGES